MCKARSNARKKKVKGKNQTMKKVSMSKDILILLNKRIAELEYLKLKEEESKCDMSNSGNQDTSNQEPNKEPDLTNLKDLRTTKCIFKAAEYCARKFSNKSQEERTEYFVRYCTNKHKICA